MTKPVRCCNWELIRVIQARIVKVSLAMHLDIGDKRVPVGHGTPTGPGMQVDTRQTKCRWEQRGAWHVRPGHDTVRDLLRVKGFAVQHQFGIELSRSPAIEHSQYRISVHA